MAEDGDRPAGSMAETGAAPAVQMPARRTPAGGVIASSSGMAATVATRNGSGTWGTAAGLRLGAAGGPADAARRAQPCRDLVIGIGNPLRGDDGVGWWLADRFASWRPAARVITVQQLTPELSCDLAQADRVLFIDAWLMAESAALAAAGAVARPPGSPALQAVVGQLADGAGLPEPAAAVRLDQLATAAAAGLQAAMEPGAFSHVLPAEQLMAITALLHGRVPQAWQLLVPAFVLAHGEGFSAPLRQLLPGAEERLREWLRNGDAVADSRCTN